MRVTSPVPHNSAPIEVIPLIDIMFFLLAGFMMVSLSQTHMKGIPLTGSENPSLECTGNHIISDFIPLI